MTLVNKCATHNNCTIELEARIGPFGCDVGGRALLGMAKIKENKWISARRLLDKQTNVEAWPKVSLWTFVLLFQHCNHCQCSMYHFHSYCQSERLWIETLASLSQTKLEYLFGPTLLVSSSPRRFNIISLWPYCSTFSSIRSVKQKRACQLGEE